MSMTGPLYFSITHHLLACIVTDFFVTLLYGMRRITTFSDKRNPETQVASMGGVASMEGEVLRPRNSPAKGFLCLPVFI